MSNPHDTVTHSDASQSPAPSKKNHRVIISAVAGLAAIGSLGTYLLVHKSHATSPLPSSLTTSVGFPVYYPTQLPDGFTYEEESASTASGILSYKLKSGEKEVIIMEQAEPPDNLMLDTTADLDPIDTSNGKAYVGKSKAYPVAILPTKQTLINISGSPSVSSDTVNGIVQKMHQLDN